MKFCKTEGGNLPKVGVLALQGNFAKHAQKLQLLGIPYQYVKTSQDLAKCDALIIPGGESTTMSKLLELSNLGCAIQEFGTTNPIMGTCAGLILLSRKVDDPRVKPLGLIDISVQRNAYGSQLDSFITPLFCPFTKNRRCRGVFIRAPKIGHVAKNVQTIISQNNEPVMVRNKNIIALTFHPELTTELSVHAYFLGCAS